MSAQTIRTIAGIMLLLNVVISDPQPCSPWVFDEETEKYYRKFCNPLTVSDAEEACKEVGGNLVTICTEDENDFVASLARTHRGSRNELLPTWIGLYRDPQNRYEFLWTNGAKCDYRRWRWDPDFYANEEDPEYSSQNHVFMYSNGRAQDNTWSIAAPDKQLHYICEKEKSSDQTS
nr:C-type lectin domain containing protein [Haemonchus contortus]